MAKIGLSWDFEIEAQAAGFTRIAGVDEAGRGCLAGPVVAAALLFPSLGSCPPGLNDSKKLTRKARSRLFDELQSLPGIEWAVGTASVEEIDRINILQAALLAMRRAVEGLSRKVDFLLVDGNILPDSGRPGRAVVSGDARVPSIAAASILAKESRDRIMERIEREYPGYGFAQHKGYGTAAHLRALAALGPCPEHRRSFAPVAQCHPARPE
ncbi:MAG: ribonuclease HII [Candidatus Methylacidiphilales bacterium]|nr:ribonuclease HII [Candidatus Methylacidiphilales bacterium]